MKIFTIFVCSILMMTLSSCMQSSNTTEKNLHNEGYNNETYNKVAVYNNDTYYISNSTLLCGVDGSATVAENVFSVQSYDGDLYYTSLINGEVWITKYDGVNKKDFYLMKNSDIKKIMISNDNIYILINNELFVKRKDDMEMSLLKQNITDFIICEKYIYCVESKMNNVETNITHLDDLSDIQIYSKIVKHDIENGHEEVIDENKFGYIIAPVDKGIVYYDRDKSELKLHINNSSKILANGMISSVISYSDFVVYSSFNENSVYRLNLNNYEQEKILDYVVNLYGITQNAVFVDDEKWCNFGDDVYKK